MFDTNWDVNKYKTTHESNEHWELRQKFMLCHKSTLPEDELVCMAQVFTNIEFLGCRYPDETMKRVAELAKGVVEEYREKKKNCLKRTFVAASDAASSKIKGVKTGPAVGSYENKMKLEAPQLKYPTLNSTFTSFVPQPEADPTNVFVNQKNHDQWPATLKKLEGPFGDFIVIFSTEMAPCCQLETSTARNKRTLRYDTKILESNQIQCTIVLQDDVFCEAVAANATRSKTKAATLALKKLRSQCYTIFFKKEPEKLNVTRSMLYKNKLVPQTEENVMDKDSVGSKMMRLMGWKGAGLGSKAQGAIEPVKSTMINRREGLGHQSNNTSKLPNIILKFLRNWISSGGNPDLVFSSDFTKEERKIMHRRAGSLGLKSRSYGNGPDRYLSIETKFDLWSVLHDLVAKGKSTNKYILLSPGEEQPE